MGWELYQQYIKPHLCTFAVTAAGTYFVTPAILPSLASAPGNTAIKAALLSGLYAILGIAICEQANFLRFI